MVEVNTQSPAIKESPEQAIIRQGLQKKITEGLVPGKPAPIVETIFRMKFKKGPVSQEVFFKFDDEQRDAEEAARSYCNRFRLRFIWVEKFFIDILSQPQEEKEIDS